MAYYLEEKNVISVYVVVHGQEINTAFKQWLDALGEKRTKSTPRAKLALLDDKLQYIGQFVSGADSGVLGKLRKIVDVTLGKPAVCCEISDCLHMFDHYLELLQMRIG